jgi:F0F1-type ATP synthase membrane subunit b/b'
MLTRICLVLAILAGIGVIVLSQFKLRPQIQGIIDERTQQTQRADKAESDLRATRGELKKTQDNLQETKNKLGETETALTAANAKAADLERTAQRTRQELDQTRATLNESRQKLSRWELLGIEPEQVKATLESEKKLKDLAAVLEDEKQVLIRENRRLTNVIFQLVGNQEDYSPPLPPGTRGKVLVVDPKWDFVVLDIGEKQGLVQNAVMMVSRSSKLVAKVRIVTVHAERAIANVMPGWKLDEVMEGDLVLY